MRTTATEFLHVCGLIIEVNETKDNGHRRLNMPSAHYAAMIAWELFMFIANEMILRRQLSD